MYNSVSMVQIIRQNTHIVSNSTITKPAKLVESTKLRVRNAPSALEFASLVQDGPNTQEPASCLLPPTMINRPISIKENNA